LQVRQGQSALELVGGVGVALIPSSE